MATKVIEKGLFGDRTIFLDRNSENKKFERRSILGRSISVEDCGRLTRVDYTEGRTGVRMDIYPDPKIGHHEYVSGFGLSKRKILVTSMLEEE
jgi:hypothetical protein